jgi:hypothetical protein
MRKLIALVFACTTFAFAASPGALAASNPNPEHGRPGQSCQEIETYPGHAPNSPGSPFNEPVEGVSEGGTGGQHYNETSQYDVACYQQSQKG